MRKPQQKFDLNDVAIFAEVADAGSFSAAAGLLRLPRASVSRAVARLEADLGAQLLYRTTRKVELTEIGRRFHDRATQGLAFLREAQEAVDAANAEPSGLLRLTAPITFGTFSLIPWMAEFLTACPQVRVSLRLTDAAIDPLAEGVDVAILTGKQPDSSHMIRRLGTSTLILVASPDYLGKRSAISSAFDLQGHDFVLFGSDGGDEVWALDGPKGIVEIRANGRLAVKGPHAELSAALSGLGIALLPDAMTASHIRAGRLAHVLPELARKGGSLNLVSPSGRHQSAALRALIEFVVMKMGCA